MGFFPLIYKILFYTSVVRNDVQSKVIEFSAVAQGSIKFVT